MPLLIAQDGRRRHLNTTDHRWLAHTNLWRVERIRVDSDLQVTFYLEGGSRYIDTFGTAEETWDWIHRRGLFGVWVAWMGEPHQITSEREPYPWKGSP